LGEMRNEGVYIVCICTYEYIMDSVIYIYLRYYTAAYLAQRLTFQIASKVFNILLHVFLNCFFYINCILILNYFHINYFQLTHTLYPIY